MNYIAIIDQENGVFGVTFLDFPGCVTSGETIDEALASAREALAFHVEGMEEDGEPIPDPTPVSGFEMEGSLADGEICIIAAVPLIRHVGKAVRIGLSVDKGVLQAIDDEARRRGMTRSAFMVGASVDQI